MLLPKASRDEIPHALIPEGISALKISLMQVVIFVLTVYYVRVAWLELEELDSTL